jgi:hypothetical protein
MSYKLKLRLLSQFGHTKRLDQIEGFWGGVPGGVARDGNYGDNFNKEYGFHPAGIQTQTALTKKLEGTHGNKIKNIENF